MEKYVKLLLNEDETDYEILSFSDDLCNEDLNSNEVIYFVDAVLDIERVTEDKYIPKLRKELIEIGKYRLYPIYRISLNFKCKDNEDDEWTSNSVCKSIMYKTPRTDDQLDEVVRNWIISLDSKYKYVSNTTDYSYKLIRYETWCLDWFCHYTFDIGQSDSEVMTSFEEYVSRYEHQQNLPVEAIEKLGDKYVCLMGAEDRWRWGHKDELTRDIVPGPCRCAGCRKAGVIRINH